MTFLLRIDSLQKENYHFYYEGYAEEPWTDSLQANRNERTLRKLLRVSTFEYFDPETNLYAGAYKIPKTYKLIDQPSAHMLGIDTTKAKRADISPAKMIEEFEKNMVKLN